MTQPSATQKPTRTRRFLDENQLIEDAFRLGVQVFESGFRPNFIVGLWRGGSAVGIYVQECLQTLGVKTDRLAPVRDSRARHPLPARQHQPG